MPTELEKRKGREKYLRKLIRQFIEAGSPREICLYKYINKLVYKTPIDNLIGKNGKKFLNKFIVDVRNNKICPNLRETKKEEKKEEKKYELKRKVEKIKERPKIKNPYTGRLIYADTEYSRKLLQQYKEEQEAKKVRYEIEILKDEIKREDIKISKLRRVHFNLIQNIDINTPLINQLNEFVEVVNDLVILYRNDFMLEHKKRPIKSNITISTRYKGNKKYYNIYHRTKLRLINYSDNDNNKGINIDDLKQIKNQIENAKRKSSIDMFIGFFGIDIYINAFIPLSSKSYIPLPKWIEDKKACVNVKNDDDKCGGYSIISAVHQAKNNINKVFSYKRHWDKFNWKDINFPMELKDFDTFEKNNPYSINIWTYEENKENEFFIVRKTPNWKQNQDMIIDLLIVEENNNRHYVWIKNLSRLLCGQINRHDGKKYLCYNCLNHFYTEEKLNKHIELCDIVNTEGTKTVMPDEEHKYIRYMNKGKGNLNSNEYVIYADFESSIINDVHKVNSYCYLPTYYIDNGTFNSGIRRGELKTYITNNDNENVVEIFINDLIKYYNICEERNGTNYPIKFTIVFHNLRGYDGHFIITELGKIFNKDEIRCIPTTKEKYLSFGNKNLRFIDSFAFLSTSLSKLSDSFFNCNNNELKTKISFFKDEFSEDKIKLLLRKGIYPYEYIDSVNKLNDNILPSIDKFYSKLYDQTVNNEEYEYANKIWKEFNCKNLRDYHELYLKTDVLLLAQIFNDFRNRSLKEFGLDPSKYVSLASFSWDCMLKRTKRKIELLTDEDMLLMFEKGMRGGQSQISQRYAKANNEKMGKEYDVNKPKSFIRYLDVNNLYGYGMMRKLPIGEFKWNNDEWNNETIMKLDKDDNYGYFFDVDLEYPKSLHDYHNDFPLAVEKMTINDMMLSKIQKDMLESREDKHIDSDKLIMNLYNKQNYMIAGTTLKLYLKLGLKLIKINRVIQFRQDYVIKSYIEQNTHKRNICKDKNDNFGKDFYKLMNNIIYGKTIENVRNRINFKLSTNVKTTKKYLTNICFKNSIIFNEGDKGLVGFEFTKPKVVMDKPIAIGVCILDYSKELMYDIWYNKLKSKYNNNIKLLMTDTDSLCFWVKTEDVDNELKNMNIICDKTIGKMKIEYDKTEICEFVGLRSKMYSLRVNGGKDKNVAKGIGRVVIEKQLKFKDYKDIILGKVEPKNVEFYNITTDKHCVKTNKIVKIGLDNYDDKRYMLSKIKTLAYGHYSIV